MPASDDLVIRLFAFVPVADPPHAVTTVVRTHVVIQRRLPVTRPVYGHGIVRANPWPGETLAVELLLNEDVADRDRLKLWGEVASVWT
jgi:hypothetical protein